MTPNLGTIDRRLRIMVAATVAVLYLSGVIGGAPAAVLGATGLIMLATGLVSFYPLYVPLGVSTRKKGASTRSTTQRF